MGNGVKIRPPRIARVRVHSAKARAITAKPAIKHSNISRHSHRYGSKIRTKRVILPKLYQGNPAKVLTSQAKLGPTSNLPPANPL